MPATSRYSTPQGFHEIDIRALRRDGFLKPGARARVILRKTFGGRVIKEARAVVAEDIITIMADGRSEIVEIVRTGQHFGGTRGWLSCPRCGGRTVKLYGSPFACRSCKGITYPSQRTDAQGRAIMRAQKLRMRLGGTASLIDPLPARPWGMWDRTYRRMMARCEAADGRAIGFASGWVERLKGHLRGSA